MYQRNETLVDKFIQNGSWQLLLRNRQPTVTSYVLLLRTALFAFPRKTPSDCRLLTWSWRKTSYVIHGAMSWDLILRLTGCLPFTLYLNLTIQMF